MRRSSVILLFLSLSFQTAGAQDWPPIRNDVFEGPERVYEPHPFDQQHIVIDVRIDPDDRTVTGYTSLEVRPLEPLQQIVLHAADMTVDSVFVEHEGIRFQAPFEQVGTDSLVITLAALPDTSVTIESDTTAIVPDTLSTSLPVEPEPEAIESTFVVTTHYTARPSIGLYFVAPFDEEPTTLTQVWSQGESEGNRHWFPVFDHPSDKLTSEVAVTMDSAYTIVSNGVLQENRLNDDGTRTMRYVQSQPHSPYLISIAAADYQPVRTHATLTNGARVPVTYWGLPHQVDLLERTLGRTPEMISYFDELLGVTYPWSKYDQVFVRDFMWGGMENTGISTLTSRALIDERAALDYNPDNLVAHELAHQWFGDLVTARDWSEVWLQEAFASHLAAMDLEQTRGHEAYLLYLERRLGYYVRESADYMRPLVWNGWVSPIDVFDRHAYDKGNWVLHMLRQQLGDELFATVMKGFLSRYAFDSYTTRDFQSVVEEISGRSFSTFFDQWVYSAGHPKVSIRYTHNPEAGKLRVLITQVQSGELVPQAFQFPLTLEIQTLGGAQRHEVQITQREHDYTFDVGMPPRYVLPDPDVQLLAEFEVEQSAAAWVAQLRHALEPVSRQRAARALARFVNEPALLVGLRGALEVEQSADVRRQIIGTIALLPNDSTKERLLITSSQDRNAEVRLAAVEALGSFVGSAAVEARLQEMAHNEPSYRAQAEAVKSLAKIGASGARSIVESALITPSFREYVRVAAFDALAVLDVPAQEGLRTALRYVQPGQPTDARRAAVKYLGTLAPNNNRAFERLVDLLEDYTYDVRSAAITALEKLQGELVVEALEARLAVEPEPKLRSMLRVALQRVSG